MESKNTEINRQKIALALYFIKENNNQELFGKWTISIGKKYLIGRKDADINIDHPLVSRKHLELIYYSNDLISVRDLDSRNGTFINNAKVNPYQEIKFNTKDKLSLGDINNKIVFIENQEIKNSIFEQKVNKDIDERVSEDTRKIPTYERRRNPNFRFRNRQFVPNRRFRYRHRYRFRPRPFQRNNYVQKPKIRDVQNDNDNNDESISSETYKEGENKDRRIQFDNRYQKKKTLEVIMIKKKIKKILLEKKLKKIKVNQNMKKKRIWKNLLKIKKLDLKN